MPKIKTHRGAAKRFKKTASGKLRYRKSFRSHILTSKTQKRKRHSRKGAILEPAQADYIKTIIPYI